MDVKVSGPTACWYHRQLAAEWLKLSHRAAENHVDAMGMGRLSENNEEALYGNGSLTTDCDEVTAGTARVAAYYNDPLLTDKRPTGDAHMAAIAASHESIALYAPYFAPSKRLVKALVAARARKVKITLITNSPWSTDDKSVVFVAMYDRLKPLLRPIPGQPDVELRMWRFKSTIHRKRVGSSTVKWVYYGSDNQDNRARITRPKR